MQQPYRKEDHPIKMGSQTFFYDTSYRSYCLHEKK